MKNIFRTCDICGKDFTPTRSNHISCSAKCNSLKWKRDNVNKHNNYNKKYKADNKEKVSKKAKLWRENNSAKRAMYQNERRVNKINAIFYGACMEYYKFFTEEIYSLAKERSKKTCIPHAVDHIIPLNNPIVCGLHHPLNLQVITASENSSKNNKFSEDF